MALLMEAEVAAAIAAHAEAIYPNECVGLLLGRFADTDKLALRAFELENRWSGQVQLSDADDASSQRDRFYLDPRDYLRADRTARAEGLEIVGCYHSHPDWPAEPSERDRVGAQAIAGPSFSFVIQSVQQGQAADLRSWLLASDGAAFEAEELRHAGDA